MNLQNIQAIAFKEVTRVRRDSNTLRMIFLQPLILIVIYGFAVTNEVYNARWLVYDQNHTDVSRRFIQEIYSTRHFEKPRFVSSYKKIHHSFLSDRTLIAIVIEPYFKNRILKGEPGRVQLLLNGADPLTASRAMSYIARVASHFKPERQVRFPSRNLEEASIVAFDKRYWFNPGVKDRLPFVMGLSAILLTQICLSIASMSLVGEKDRGTLEQLLSTPVDILEIILGKLIPYIVISYFNLLLILGMSYILFGMASQGNLIGFFIATFPFITATLTVSVFFSGIARNIQQGIYMSVFFILPSVILSGYLVPVSTMPRAIQIISYIFPMRYYVDIIYDILMRGAAFSDIIPSTLALVVYTLVGLFLAVRVTRRTIG